MPTNVGGFAEAEPLEGYVKPSSVNAACDQIVPQPRRAVVRPSFQTALVAAPIHPFSSQQRRRYHHGRRARNPRESTPPLYDSVAVDGEKQISDVEKSGTLKFFVNVQGKTKLETNLQSASLLPHYNTFEARAMRVVISDLPPEFPADDQQGPLAATDEVEVSDASDAGIRIRRHRRQHRSADVGPGRSRPASRPPSISSSTLFKEAAESDDGFAELDVDDDAVS